MTVQHVTDLTKPIGEILNSVGPEGSLLEPPGDARYALLPLDDDLIDYLLERSPKLIQECQRLRQELQAGRFRTHEEVKRMFAGE